MFLLACFGLQVIGIAVFFALLMKPVAVEETEEIEQVLLGKKKHYYAFHHMSEVLELYKHRYCGYCP